MLEPDYCKARLLEIGWGEGFGNPIFLLRMFAPSTCEWSSRCGDSSVEASERLQEITATDDRTPIAVEIISQVDLIKVSKQERGRGRWTCEKLGVPATWSHFATAKTKTWRVTTLYDDWNNGR